MGLIYQNGTHKTWRPDSLDTQRFVYLCRSINTSEFIQLDHDNVTPQKDLLLVSTIIYRIRYPKNICIYFWKQNQSQTLACKSLLDLN